jgi:hypothetical protein
LCDTAQGLGLDQGALFFIPKLIKQDKDWETMSGKGTLLAHIKSLKLLGESGMLSVLLCEQ